MKGNSRSHVAPTRSVDAHNCRYAGYRAQARHDDPGKSVDPTQSIFVQTRLEHCDNPYYRSVPTGQNRIIPRYQGSPYL